MDLVLGVDGGGTRTRGVLVDAAGRLRAAATGGSINLDDHPWERAEAELRALFDHLRREANDGSPVRAAFLTVGGVLTEADREATRGLAAAATRLPPATIGVHHDAFGALAGGLAGEAGMVLVAGTGSICFGRNRDGQESWCGNWGPMLGDEGSGHWLGLEALRAVARAHDGRNSPTALTEAVLAWLGVDAPEELLRRVHVGGLTRGEIAAFAPTVLRIASAGDAVAQDLTARGAHALAQCVRVVRDALFDPAENMGRPVATVLVGGLTRDEAYRRDLERAVARVAPRTRVVEPRLPPVLGAARVALERAGVEVHGRIDASLAEGRSRLGRDG